MLKGRDSGIKRIAAAVLLAAALSLISASTVRAVEVPAAALQQTEAQAQLSQATSQSTAGEAAVLEIQTEDPTAVQAALPSSAQAAAGSQASAAASLQQDGTASDPNAPFVLSPDWQQSVNAERTLFSAVKTDGTARFTLQLMPSYAQFPTTQAMASGLMAKLQGFDLKPVLSQRGFIFSYTDVLPCAALLSYYDGAQYLFNSACGLISKDEYKHFYREASTKLQLNLNTAKPALR